jgi:hypothetical protein
MQRNSKREATVEKMWVPQEDEHRIVQYHSQLLMQSIQTNAKYS